MSFYFFLVLVSDLRASFESPFRFGDYKRAEIVQNHPFSL